MRERPRAAPTPNQYDRVYIAGPMRGLPEFNFPAFHSAAAVFFNINGVEYVKAKRGE